MECKVDNDLLQGYVEGDLEKIEKIILDEHLKNCKKCRTEVTHLKLLMYEINELKDENIDFPDELDKLRENTIGKIYNKKYVRKKNSAVKKLKALGKYTPSIGSIGHALGKTSLYFGSASYKFLKYSFRKIQKGF